jgi:hypothetical protein
VMLAGKLAICLTDLLVGRVSLYPKHFVVVFKLDRQYVLVRQTISSNLRHRQHKI